MDLRGLDSVITASDMLTWLANNCVTPIKPAMSGSDFGVIMQKIINVSGGTGSFADYLKSLPGYVGDGSKVLGDDLTWQSASNLPILEAPRLFIESADNTNISLSWKTPDAATGFVLQRSLDGFFTPEITTVYTGSDNSFTDTGLALATTYWYRVKSTADGYSDSPYSDIASDTTTNTPGQIVNIVFTNTGPISEANWNNLVSGDYIGGVNGWTKPNAQEGVSPYLTDSNGGNTTWQLSLSLDTQFLYNSDANSNVQSASDFPDDVLITQWRNPNAEQAAIINLNFSGLDPSKTYDIKTVHHDGGSLLNITVSWNDNGQTGDQSLFDGTIFIPLEFTFLNLTPDGNGNIAGTIVNNESGNSVINGIIILEN